MPTNTPLSKNVMAIDCIALNCIGNSQTVGSIESVESAQINCVLNKCIWIMIAELLRCTLQNFLVIHQFLLNKVEKFYRILLFKLQVSSADFPFQVRLFFFLATTRYALYSLYTFLNEKIISVSITKKERKKTSLAWFCNSSIYTINKYENGWNT